MYKQTAAALENAQRIVITAHINPDGDAIGSALGLYHALTSLGKEVRVVMPTPVPSTMAWMPGMHAVEVFSTDPTITLGSADTIVVLDLNSVARLKDFGVLITSTRASSLDARASSLDAHGAAGIRIITVSYTHLTLPTNREV